MFYTNQEKACKCSEVRNAWDNLKMHSSVPCSRSKINKLDTEDSEVMRAGQPWPVDIWLQ